jgi:TPP-dependent pyruvate/acetoin dehydrogenase alpha subunit
VSPDEVERWAAGNDPVDRYVRALLHSGWAEGADLDDIDARVRDEVDEATDACLTDPLPPAESALGDVYAAPASAEQLWYRLV